GGRSSPRSRTISAGAVARSLACASSRRTGARRGSTRSWATPTGRGTCGRGSPERPWPFLRPRNDSPKTTRARGASSCSRALEFFLAGKLVPAAAVALELRANVKVLLHVELEVLLRLLAGEVELVVVDLTRARLELVPAVRLHPDLAHGALGREEVVAEELVPDEADRDERGDRRDDEEARRDRVRRRLRNDLRLFGLGGVSAGLSPPILSHCN